jgi:hypothetical protein
MVQSYNYKKILLVAVPFLFFFILLLFLTFLKKNINIEEKSANASDAHTIITSYGDWVTQSKDVSVNIEIVQGSVILSQQSEYRNLDGSWSTNASGHMLCVLDGINDVGDENGDTSCGEMVPGDYIIHELPDNRYITKVGINHFGYPHLIPLLPSYRVEYWNGLEWIQCAEVIDASEGDTLTTQDPLIYTNKIKTTIIEGGANLIEILEALDYSADFASSGSITSASTQIDGQEGSDDKTLIQWTSFTPTQTVPENTTATYQFRTSDNASDWTAWTGDYTYSGDPIDLTGLDDDRYLQVKATLSNTDGVSSPQIDDYTINFHNNQKPNQPTAQTAIIGD